MAWQSAGRTPEPWLGPDLLDVMPMPRPAEGSTPWWSARSGFVADHLEVLYDLDVEARPWPRGPGLAFARTASLNDDPAFLDVLAGVVAAGPPGRRG